MIEYFNNITAELVDGFHTELNKIRYLRNTVVGKKWETTPLKNISRAQYNFNHLEMALNDSVQFEREIEKVSSSSKTHYGHFQHKFQGITQICFLT